MVIPRGVYLALLAALAGERLFELWLSKRNARRAFARGGIELGRGQYLVLVAFHALFLAACAAGAIVSVIPPSAVMSTLALLGEIIAQAIRYWSVATLGEKWNTRVIVIAGDQPVTRGPYRYVRHPNYAAVALEIACLPLMRGLVIIAMVFSLANGLVLALRIRLEERALGEAYARAFAARSRFIPGMVR